MKITKLRLIEIIKEEIQDFRTEQNIRKQIREFVSTHTVTGAQKAGYKSGATKAKQSTYDTAVSDSDTADQAHTDKLKDEPTYTDRGVKKSAIWRIAAGGKGVYNYSDAKNAPSRSWQANPLWSTWSTEKTNTSSTKDQKASDETSALSDLETSQEADLQAQKSKQAPPSGVGSGAGFGKGKAAGKGRGKGKKKKV